MDSPYKQPAVAEIKKERAVIFTGMNSSVSFKEMGGGPCKYHNHEEYLKAPTICAHIIISTHIISIILQGITDE